MLKLFFRNSTVLLSGMIVCGLLALHFGKEVCWDLANYHYYVPYAFLHGRYTIDYWPTSYIHQFLNPTIDFISYFLIHSTTPIMAVFTLGAIHGINFWLIFLISRLFLKDHFLIPLGLACLAIYGPLELPGLGSFQNDMLVSIFVLTFVYLQLWVLQNDQAKKIWHFLPGFFLGIGVGLKLTAALFVIGAFFAFLFVPLNTKTKFKLLFIFMLSVILGMLVSAGYWMLILWREHGNPLFPFFNYYFRSPDFAPINWRDTRFLPRSLSEALFFPFYFSWQGTGDIPFQDFRFLVVYVLFVFAALKWLWQHFSSQPKLRSGIQNTRWLLLFFVFSYITWEYEFSIARYFIPLELLSPLIIYLLIIYLVENFYLRIMFLYLSFYIIVAFLVTEEMIRTPSFQSTFFNIKMPQVVNMTNKALVLMAYPAYVLDRDPQPQSYLIPYFPSAWQFIGVPFVHEKYLADHAVTEKINKLIDHNHTSLYLLTSATIMPEFYRATVQFFHLMPGGTCEKIFSDRQAITNEDVLLCPAVRKS